MRDQQRILLLENVHNCFKNLEKIAQQVKLRWFTKNSGNHKIWLQNRLNLKKESYKTSKHIPSTEIRKKKDTDLDLKMQMKSMEQIADNVTNEFRWFRLRTEVDGVGAGNFYSWQSFWIMPFPFWGSLYLMNWEIV